MIAIKPTVKLVGGNGNMFSIISNVNKALVGAGQHDKANEFLHRAFNEGRTYDEILVLVHEYCEVT